MQSTTKTRPKQENPANQHKRNTQKTHRTGTHHEYQQRIDITTVQETKLAKHHKTPTIPQYSTCRTDRTHKKGGGLIHNYMFGIWEEWQLHSSQHSKQHKQKQNRATNHQNSPHTNKASKYNQHLNITNICIPPRYTTDPNHSTEDTDITKTFTHLTSIKNHLITGADLTTMQAISSDHLPILITYKTKTNYKIQQHRRTYTNYNKAM